MKRPVPTSNAIQDAVPKQWAPFSSNGSRASRPPVHGRAIVVGQLALLGAIGVWASAQPGVAAPPVEAVVPARWTPPHDQEAAIDFAEAAQADAWLRHVVLGDPSFDSFRRREGNPIVRGKAPFDWPVNGFLLEDPQSGNWYAYVGYYLAGYNLGPGLPTTHCRVHRSQDKGQTWEDLGPIFHDPAFRFEGDSQTANGAPDVSVVFAGGRYHMAYDWCTDNTTWANASHPADGADSGCAYAWAERPEGPFHRAERPILRTSEMPRRFAMARKYPRVYATTLVRREHDWLTLTLTDSGPFFSWGLMAMTAPDPAGPWTDPVLALGIEGDAYFPPTVESFPAMVHDGFVYASNTSVAANRNFQAVYRAKIESAHRPEGWTLFQHGTTWHAEPVVHEGLGLWGQTYSGFVDAQGVFQVLFPSRERATGLGTINLASRPWSQPLAERGFTLSGHEGPSLTLLRSAWKTFQLKADLAVRGGPARILWGYQAPLGGNQHSSGATPNALSLAGHRGLEISEQGWRVLGVDAAGAPTVSAEGTLGGGPLRQLAIQVGPESQCQVEIDGRSVWEGEFTPAVGPIGLLVEPSTHLRVARFVVAGRREPAVLPWLYVEALTGAGVSMADWDGVRDPLYRFGVGALRKAPGGRAKWNFRGRGFRLWSPKGPDFGACEVVLNGRKLADLDLHSDRPVPSEIVYACEDAGDGYHALVLRSTAGRLVVDSLDALQ